MRTFGNSKKGLYRSRNGVILGVCRGVADYFDIKVFWVRAIMVIIFLLSGFWPVIGIYLVAALLMKPEAAQSFANDDERDFYDSYAHSPQSAAQRLKKSSTIWTVESEEWRTALLAGNLNGSASSIQLRDLRD